MAEESKNQVEETTEEIEETKEKKVENKEPEKKYSDEQVDEIIKEKKAKWQKQQDEKIKELEEYKQRENQSAMAKVAKNMLVEEGFNISDDLVNNLITDEAESTKENVKDFAGMLKDLVEKEVNERLKGKSPEVRTTRTKTSRALESEIYGIKDSVKRREALLKNPELYN